MWQLPTTREAVIQAALHASWREVATALARGYPVHFARFEDGLTLLHVAASAGHADTVREVLRKGGDPNVRSSSSFSAGFSAMHHAATGGTPEVLRLLVEAGGDINGGGGATSDPPLVVLLRGMATTKQYGGNLDAARARLAYMLTVPSLALPLLVDGRPMDAWARLRGLDDIADALVEVGANAPSRYLLLGQPGLPPLPHPCPSHLTRDK
jgi:hypothetical protein